MVVDLDCGLTSGKWRDFAHRGISDEERSTICAIYIMHLEHYYCVSYRVCYLLAGSQDMSDMCIRIRSDQKKTKKDAPIAFLCIIPTNSEMSKDQLAVIFAYPIPPHTFELN